MNTDYQLISGNITTIYDLSNSLTLNVTDVISSLTSETETESNPFTDDCSTQIDAGEGIESVTVSGSTITVTGTDGKTTTTTVSSGQTVAVTASSGEQYVVDGSTGTVYSQATSGGQAPSGGSSDLSQPSSDQLSFSATFSQHDKQTYGFDLPGDNTPDDNYDNITVAGSTTKVPWKSIQTGQIDKVMATISGKPYDSVYFSRNSAQMVMKAPGSDDNQRQLLATGDSDQETDQLYAWYTYTGQDTTASDSTTSSSSSSKKYYLAGAVNLASYETQAINLCLVSVNGSTVPDASYIQQQINKIYAPAITTWNVSSLDGGLSVTLSSTNQKLLDNTDADDNMNLTDEEKLVKKAMKKLDAYNSDTYYLFFLESGKDATINGYMPFKGHFGFIFKNSQDVDVLLRTIAHEIGHGPFRLRHTFSTENKYYQTQGTTTNLMDYVASEKALTAKNLYKYQWDYIHNPEAIWFTSSEDEEEGESINHPYLSCVDESLISKLTSKIFYDPAGNIIDIGDATPYAFFNLNDEKTLQGRLAAFYLDDVLYNTFYYTGDLSFAGYAPSGTSASEFAKYKYTETTGVESKAQKVNIASSSGSYEIYVNGTKTSTGTISNCKCQNIPSEEDNVSTTSSTDNSSDAIVIDYSQGTDNNSLLPSTSLDSLKLNISNLNTKFGLNAKIYVINKQNPLYEEKLAEANADQSVNKYIFIINSGSQDVEVVNLDYKFTPPDWFTSIYPNVNNSNCIVEYINEGLDKLHESADYKSSTWIGKIKAEYSLAFYRGFFGMWYCATSEEAVSGKTNFEKYFAGATHELIVTIDIETLVSGIIELIKTNISTQIDSYDSYFSDIKQTITDISGGNIAKPAELCQRLLPPAVRTITKDIKIAQAVGKEFIHLYFDCDTTFLENGTSENMCAYRYGQLTVLLAPIILSAGEYAVAKAQAIATRLTAQNLSKAQEVAQLLKTAEEAGSTIKLGTQKIITRDGKTLTTVEKNGSEVTITTEAESDILASIKDEIGYTPSSSLDFTGFAANTGDNFLDIIIHYKDGKFVICQESAFASETELTLDELANIIEKTAENSSGQTVRLLSCNDLEVAQLLSKKTTQPFYASDGWVDLYKDGTVTSEKPFYKFQNGEQGGQLAHNTEGSGLDKITLGETLAKTGSKAVKSLSLGNKIGKVGKYEIFENGEVFYRAIPKSHLEDLKATGKIKVPVNPDGTITSEMFTSPTIEYITQTGYDGVIIKFQMKPGTLEELKKIGRIPKDNVGDILYMDFGDLPVVEKGWMKENTLFKIEGRDKGIEQVNIGLGRDGKGMQIFNDNILYFQVVE